MSVDGGLTFMVKIASNLCNSATQKTWNRRVKGFSFSTKTVTAAVLWSCQWRKILFLLGGTKLLSIPLEVCTNVHFNNMKIVTQMICDLTNLTTICFITIYDVLNWLKYLKCNFSYFQHTKVSSLPLLVSVILNSIHITLYFMF